MNNVLITGGSGTLGNALTKRLYETCSITIFSRDPIKQIRMGERFPRLRFVLGDIRDFAALKMAMTGHDTVIHAAAQKHIPQGEINVTETISVNVTGSQNVAQAAIESGVKQVVGISTDKVCDPVNVYGMTKALMERVFQEYNRLGITDFHLCRYGNVLRSTGSVVNVWREMLARDGYVTATDPNMSRFWMTEDDAVRTVMIALNAVEPGVVFVPKLKSLNMGKFAEYVLPDAEFRYSGLRPGEKRHETLVSASETYRTVEIDSGYLIMEVGDESGCQPFSSDTAEALTKAELLGMIE